MSTLIPENLLATPVIPSTEGITTIQLYSGRPAFIVGRNGTGKSALVHRLSGLLGDKVVYMPGSRPSYFESDSLSMTPSSRRSFSENVRNWDSNLDTRVRPISGTTRNEKAIHDLQTAETQYKLDAANQIKIEGAASAAITRLQSSDSLT
jgi:ATPase subunit of ABC transporter with duplicated ATPase domains